MDDIIHGIISDVLAKQRAQTAIEIAALERVAATIKEHAAGKREFGWKDQAHGLELALAIVTGSIEGKQAWLNAVDLQKVTA
jgi:hypothetical protein